MDSRRRPPSSSRANRGRPNNRNQHSQRPNPNPPPAREMGFCKWFNRKRGFGFIVADMNDPDEEGIFVHRSELVSGDIDPILLDGEEVEYTPERDDTDRMCATKVTWPDGERIYRSKKRRDIYAQVHPAACGIVTGRVKWFDETRGCGFITCDDANAFNDHDRDVFVHRDDISGHIKSLCPGERVEFFVRVVRNRGEERAKAVSVTGPGGRSVRGSQEFHDRKKSELPPPLDLSKFKHDQQYQGVVKWFNYKNRFGYIRFGDTGDEVFVSSRDVRNSRPLSEGDKVEFYVGRDSYDRPKALNVTVLHSTRRGGAPSTSRRPQQEYLEDDEVDENDDAEYSPNVHRRGNERYRENDLPSRQNRDRGSRSYRSRGYEY